MDTLSALNPVTVDNASQFLLAEVERPARQNALAPARKYLKSGERTAFICSNKGGGHRSHPTPVPGYHSSGGKFIGHNYQRRVDINTCNHGTDRLRSVRTTKKDVDRIIHCVEGVNSLRTPIEGAMRGHAVSAGTLRQATCPDDVFHTIPRPQGKPDAMTFH